MASQASHRRSLFTVIGLIGFAVALTAYSGATSTDHPWGRAFSISAAPHDLYSVAPLREVVALVASPRQNLVGASVLLTPDDMTFAKINRMALRPSLAWEVALDNGAWRRISV